MLLVSRRHADLVDIELRALVGVPVDDRGALSDHMVARDRDTSCDRTYQWGGELVEPEYTKGISSTKLNQGMREIYSRMALMWGPVQESPNPQSRVTLHSRVRDKFGIPNPGIIRGFGHFHL